MAVAAISAIPIVMFFYFDQNLSSLLTQQVCSLGPPSATVRLGTVWFSDHSLLNLVTAHARLT
eukprot:SAG11_NODE_700_length_7673_cov_7.359255_4_plen_63_part_00